MNIDQIFAERRRKRAFVAMRIPDEGWVELPGNVVFDGVLQRFYDLGKYYESEYARPWYRFTRRAVVWVLAQHLPTWRWDRELGLPLAKSAMDRTAEVLPVDKDDAQVFLAAAKKNAQAFLAAKEEEKSR